MDGVAVAYQAGGGVDGYGWVLGGLGMGRGLGLAADGDEVAGWFCGGGRGDGGGGEEGVEEGAGLGAGEGGR